MVWDQKLKNAWSGLTGTIQEMEIRKRGFTTRHKGYNQNSGSENGEKGLAMKYIKNINQKDFLVPVGCVYERMR